MAYSAQEPIATWNSARGAWETLETSIICGHSVPYSQIFPTSGMTLGGRLYPLPMPEHPTDASASSSSPGLLKTPTAQLAVNGGSQHPDKRREGGHGPTLADQVEHGLPTASPLLPTPAARDWRSGKSNMMEINARPLNEVVVNFLPTPTAVDGKGPNPLDRERDGKLRPLSDDDLPTSVARLLPTPAAHDSANTPENHLRKKPGRSQVTSLQVIADYGLIPTGGHMPALSADGSTPPDDQLPGQLSLDELESA